MYTYKYIFNNSNLILYSMFFCNSHSCYNDEIQSSICKIFIQFAQVHNVGEHKKCLTFYNPAKSLIRYGCGPKRAGLKSFHCIINIELRLIYNASVSYWQKIQDYSRVQKIISIVFTFYVIPYYFKDRNCSSYIS